METTTTQFENETTSFVPSDAIETRLEPDASEHELFSRSMDSMADEPLATLVIDGVRKFREIIPAIIELRKRFNDRPRGHAGIAGCSTWTEFCTAKLGRTVRAVQKAIAISNTPAEELKQDVDAQGPWVEKKAAKLNPGMTPLTDEEQAAKQERQERLDRDARLLREAKEASNEESAALINNKIVPVPPAAPVVVKNQELEEYKLIAAKNVRALEIADELLLQLYHASDASQHSLIMKYLSLRNIPLSAIPALEKGGVE